MIKINKGFIVAKDVAVSDEVYSRQHVPFTENWIAFNSLDDNTKWAKFDITIEANEYNPSVINTTAVGYIKDNMYYILSARGVSYNSLYFASLKSPMNIVVPETIVVGLKDLIYKNKYIITTSDGYWRPDGLPIVLHKQRKSRKGN